MTNELKDFAEKILQTLTTNGFPGKRVSLPTDRMYEAADNKGMSFNSVLEVLKADHNVDAEIGPEKIIFSRASAQDMMKQAQEMMSKMDPEELRKIQDMFMNMSEDEKAEILRKGKDMGII